MEKKIEKILKKCIVLLEKDHSLRYCLSKYSKHKNILRIFILIIFLVVVFLVISELKPRENINQITEFEPDGIDMKYTIFSKENKKRLELSCIESKSQGKTKTLMKKINATIYKKGKLDQDISISGESGYVDDNFNKFYIEKKANIVIEVIPKVRKMGSPEQSNTIKMRINVIIINFL